MEETQMLQVLNRIKNCLENCSLDIAKQYVKLEIENLNGFTEQRCQNTKYFFFDWYCKYCLNHNCSSKNK